METINHPDFDSNKNRIPNRHNPAGRVLAGIVIVAAGGVLLAKQAGIYFPDWVFTWQMFLIVLGIFLGFRNLFRGSGWLIPIIIGSVMMVDEFYPDVQMKQYLWPIVLICVGLFMVFRPRNYRRENWKKRWRRDYSGYNSKATASEEFLDVTCVFSGMKRNVMTKDFKGGEVNCVFGGTEINLSNADIKGPVRLEINQVFGGTSLIIPSNWELRSEINAILGGVEDKRSVSPSIKTDPEKILILEGNCVFGGIDIKSY